MIHVVTVEPYEPELVDAVRRAVFTGFGVGAELTGQFSIPESAIIDGALDAEKLAFSAESIKTFADDKILYLVKRPFRPRASPAGLLPTHGFADYGKDRAVISAALITQGYPTIEAQGQRLAKLALHTVGHLFDLHHCVDVRCAMQVPWGVVFLQGQSVELCSFCRDKSERRMKNLVV
jgi:predicted Zn-dependent protease